MVIYVYSWKLRCKITFPSMTNALKWIIYALMFMLEDAVSFCLMKPISLKLQQIDVLLGDRLVERIILYSANDTHMV